MVDVSDQSGPESAKIRRLGETVSLVLCSALSLAIGNFRPGCGNALLTMIEKTTISLSPVLRIIPD